MADTIERLTFRNSGPFTPQIQHDTVRLHKERYHYAARQASGRRVLDIACGAGYGSAIMADAGAVRVAGVDISDDAIAEAREEFGRDTIEFFQSDYRDLAGERCSPELAKLLQDGFDMIVSLETIEHMPDPSDFLGTVLRFLRPGGLFVGSVPVTPSMDANPYHLSDFTPRSFRRLLEGCGLVVKDTLEQRQPYNPFSVRREMAEGKRDGLRRSLLPWYAKHPTKFLFRVHSTLTRGFVNIYHVNLAEKVGG